MMGGLGSGRPRVTVQMAQWYLKYRAPPGSTHDYQFPAYDSALVARKGLTLEDARAFRRAMPRLDLLVITPTEVRIVELKPNAQLRDVGQAIQYKMSLERDVFMGPLLNRPIKLVMCTLRENASVRALCEAQGIEYITIPALELPPPPE